MKTLKSTGAKIVYFILAEAMYALLAYQLYPHIGDVVYMLSVFPVAFGALLFGAQGGLIGGFLGITINYQLSKDIPEAPLTLFNNVVSSFAFITIGLILGWVREVQMKLRQEIMRREYSEGEILKLVEALRASKKVVEEEVKEKSKELNLEEARMAAAGEGLPAGIIIFNSDLTIALKNPALEKILSVESGSLTAEEVMSRIGQAFDLRGAIRQCIHEGIVVVRSDLKVGAQYMRVFLAPVRLSGGQGQISGCVLLLDDITEQKRLEYSKNMFLAIASHELRTPLTIIRGNAELALKSIPAKSGLRKPVASIEENAVRLLRIVSDLLDFSAIEEKQIEVKKDIIPAAGLIKGIMPGMTLLAKKKKLSLEFEDKAPAGTAIIGDADRAKEILINVVSNAIQYTDAGEVRIVLEPHGQLVKISVIDTGIGISVETQKIIFEKFQVVQERFLETKDYGSGMGLYISKLLAELTGGRIALENSVPGKGSTFCIYLPRSGGRSAAL